MIHKSIEKVLKEKDLARNADRAGRPHRFSPSSFGRCYRLQYWNRKAEPISDPPDTKGMMKMAEGTKTHEMVQSYLPKEVVEVEILTDDVKGYADIVTEDCVYDIKTCDEWQFKRYWRIPTDKAVLAKSSNFLQVCWYALELKKKYACIIGWIKGTLREECRVEHKIEAMEFYPQLVEELDTLRMFWLKEELPPAVPRAFGGYDCNYCNWRTKCKELEHGK